MNFSCNKKVTTTQRKDLNETDYPDFTLFKRGRHKELYDFGETLLVVATDQVSICSTDLDEIIPGKGQLVNQLSAYWFKQLSELLPNHFISTEVSEFPEPCQAYAEQLEGRSMLVKKTTPLAVICVVHGYLTGKGWQEYQKTGAMAGIRLPTGMVESQRLPGPLFIPHVLGETTEIGFTVFEEHFGRMLAEKLRNAALKLYFKAWKIARQRGVLLVESTFEFGLHEGTVHLIDECITPESSLFWDLKTYKARETQPFLGRNFMLASSVNRQGTGLTKKMQHKIYQNYQDLYQQLTKQKCREMPLSYMTPARA